MNVLSLGLLTIALIPTCIVFIYKSEQKQAKFNYQMQEYRKDCVETDFKVALPENNFKLLSGSGLVTSHESVTDEQFAMRLENTIAVRRVVSVFSEIRTKKKEPSSCGHESVDEEETIKGWKRVNEGEKAIGFGSESFVAAEFNLGDHFLCKEQIESIGSYKTLDLSDEIVLHIRKELEDQLSPLFTTYKHIIRSGKHLILRVARDEPEDGNEDQRVFGPHDTTTQTQVMYYRSLHEVGDVRIHWEYVTQAKVNVLAQQV